MSSRSARWSTYLGRPLLRYRHQVPSFFLAADMVMRCARRGDRDPDSAITPCRAGQSAAIRPVRRDAAARRGEARQGSVTAPGSPALRGGDPRRRQRGCGRRNHVPRMRRGTRTSGSWPRHARHLPDAQQGARLYEPSARCAASRTASRRQPRAPCSRGRPLPWSPLTPAISMRRSGAELRDHVGGSSWAGAGPRGAGPAAALLVAGWSRCAVTFAQITQA